MRKRGIAFILALFLLVMIPSSHVSAAGLSPVSSDGVVEIHCETGLSVDIRTQSGSADYTYTYTTSTLWVDEVNRRLHFLQEYNENGGGSASLLRLVNGRLYTEYNGVGCWSTGPVDFNRQLTGLPSWIQSAMDGEGLIGRAKEQNYSESKKDGLLILEGIIPADDPVVEDLLALLPPGEERGMVKACERLIINTGSGRLKGIEWDIVVRSWSGDIAETELGMNLRVEFRYNTTFPPF